MKMGLREAYQMVIKHQLELIEEEEGWPFPNKDSLAEKLHENEFVLENFKESLQEYLEIHGDDYDLF